VRAGTAGIGLLLLAFCFHRGDTEGAWWTGAVLVVIGAWTSLRAAPTAPPAPAEGPRLEIAVLILGVGCAAVALVAHRPDLDDSFYVNVAVAAADSPERPLLREDTLHGIPGLASPSSRLPRSLHRAAERRVVLSDRAAGDPVFPRRHRRCSRFSGSARARASVSASGSSGLADERRCPPRRAYRGGRDPPMVRELRTRAPLAGQVRLSVAGGTPHLRVWSRICAATEPRELVTAGCGPGRGRRRYVFGVVGGARSCRHGPPGRRAPDVPGASYARPGDGLLRIRAGAGVGRQGRDARHRAVGPIHSKDRMDAELDGGRGEAGRGGGSPGPR